ncbi:MAG: lipoprotein signal peptidase [Gammaproteobacteria bacterium]|nr:lipoprotein signal peptidase [Gammaproteobacteria bacterium]
MRWLWFSVLIIALDQSSKHWIVTALAFGEMRRVAPFFNVVRAHNAGAAFSFLEGASGWQRWLFTAIALGVSGVLIAWLRRLPATARLLPAALALIVGGAVGNLIDRLRFGYVVDFLDFHWAGWHFWSFNVADAGITCGAALLLLDSLRAPRGGAAAAT